MRSGVLIFQSATPYLWNALPSAIRNIKTLDTFETAVKTQFFNLTFKQISLLAFSVHLLEVPNVRLKNYGDRAFSVAAPKHWNDIPLDIKLSRSVDVFKSRLKTYLFRLAFN